MATPEKFVGSDPVHKAANMVLEHAPAAHPAAPGHVVAPPPPAPPPPAPPPPAHTGSVVLTRPMFPTAALTMAQAPHASVTLKPPINPTALTSLINLKRIPATVDPIGAGAHGLEPALNPFRLAASAKVFGGLQRINQHVGVILKNLQQTKLPPKLVGALHQPDGSAAVRVQVQFHPASVGGTGPAEIVLTADDGGFTLNMPANAAIPDTGLSLTVHGANSNANVTVLPDQIAANGMIGVLTLPSTLYPLPVSILAQLKALIPTSFTPQSAVPLPPAKKHSVTIGEKDSTCVQSFVASEKVDRFPWCLFFRIVEPQMSIVTETQEFAFPNSRFAWMPIFVTEPKPPVTINSKFVDRVPVGQPLSVDGFRDQIAGINTYGTFTEDETVPMAASLGLGYILRMSQQWNFQGLGLGDLVYSLPLAPGEQQQVAVFERQDTSTVQESEFFSQSEVMNQVALADTSTNATFNSAFNEMINGSSAFTSDSKSSSSGASGGGAIGFGPIVIGGGASTSSGSQHDEGSSSSSLSGSRDTTMQAAQATHSSAENQASARLNANRTGMRLATASENMGVTTKTITNHNHTHALTMQYWEVQRMFDVTTNIEGLSLVCLVPMQIVRFMPPGQPAALTDPSIVDSQPKVLARYSNILRHLDVLQREVPRQFQHGLTLLAQFAADPTTVVDSASTSSETVILFKLDGTFLSCETVSIVAVTKRNTRVGPVRLSGQPPAIPQDTFMEKDELVAWLSSQRQNTVSRLQGSLALPPSINRSDIIGFEISRQFNTVRYTLTSAAKQAVEQAKNAELHGQTPPAGSWITQLLTGGFVPTPTVTLGPGELEQTLGGPTLGGFYAAVENFNKSGTDTPSPQETYANDNLSGTILPPQPLPVPALQLAPVLRYQDVLEIEKVAQHIVRNTTRYSKALWMSMTPEESAILLDGYTIGVPPDGLSDSSQMVPLLNCVQNVILGTFGNSLIMPFNIPPDVAAQVGLSDPSILQQALLAFHREAFVPPHSTVALPTRGVLGEAVLGHCPSAEKIDLTRFWNWQDAPADTAPGIGMVQLPTTTPPLTTGVTAPNSLTNLPPLINNLITAPRPDNSLLTAMGQQAASQADFNPSLTGQQQLASIMQNGQTLANSARSDALKTSQTMATKAMDTMAQLVTTSINAASGAAGGAKPPQQPGTPSQPGAKQPGTQQPGSNKQGTAPAQSGTPGKGGQTPSSPASPAAADGSAPAAADAAAPAAADASAPAAADAAGIAGDSSLIDTAAEVAPLLLA